MLGNRLIKSNDAAAGGCTDIVDNYDPFGGNGVALYQLNGDALDSSPNAYNGTWSGTEAYGTGVFGQAGVFNGSTSKITLTASATTPIDLSTDNFTISFWIKGATNASYGGLLSKYGNIPANRSFYSYRNTNGTIVYGLISTTDVFNAITSNGINPINQWTHVVFVRNSTTQSIYLDGAFDNSISNTTTTKAIAQPLLVGDTDDTVADEFFEGSIDQIRFFNTALTPLEIEALYTEELCICDGTVDTLDILGDGSCIATYQLDGNANDLSGNYSGTPTDVSYGVGEFDLAGVFNGSSSIITLGQIIPINSDSDFSFSQWINPASLPSSGNATTIWGTPGSNIAAVRLIIRGVAGGFEFELVRGFNSTIFYSSSTSSTLTSLSTGIWYNLTFTYVSSTKTVKFYLNGVELGNGYTLDTSTSFTINSGLALGAYQGTNSSIRFNGSIDQVRIFNKALSAGEVTTLYDETACSIPVPQDVDYSNLDISQASVRQVLYNQDPSVRGDHMGIAPNGQSIVWSGYDLSYVKALGQSFLSVPTNITSYNTGIYPPSANIVDYNNGYRKVEFADNGYVLYFSDLNVLTVVYLANPYDVSSYTSFNKYTITGNRSAFFNQDGSIMYLKNIYSFTTDSKIYQYSTSNFVYSTANLVGEFSTDGLFGASFQQRTATISPDGRKIICVGTGAGRLDQLDLSTPFDITTASFNNKTLFTKPPMWRDPANVSFSLDGTIMYVGSQQGLASYNITL